MYSNLCFIINRYTNNLLLAYVDLQLQAPSRLQSQIEQTHLSAYVNRCEKELNIREIPKRHAAEKVNLINRLNCSMCLTTIASPLVSAMLTCKNAFAPLQVAVRKD